MSLFPDFGAEAPAPRAAPLRSAPLGSAPLRSGGLFAHDFDAPTPGGVILLDEEESPPPEPPAPPPITADDLAAACAAAHHAGRAAGLASAEAARDAERRALLATLSAQLGDAEAQIRAAVDEAGGALSRLVLAALQAGFPALGARHGAAEIARFTAEVTALLAAEPRIVIRVHPAMLPAVEAVLATLEPERREAVLVEPRDTLPPGDARIAWRHGLAVRDTGRLLARIGEVLAPLGLAPDAESLAAQPALHHAA